MKTFFAALALAMLATSAQASDIKVYDKSKPVLKVAASHKTGVSEQTVHGRAESGSKTKGAASSSVNGLDRVQESLAGDKHKTKKSKKLGRTKF